MIIDFRVRPPLPGFEKLSILGPTYGFETFPFNYEGTATIPSAKELSMSKFLAEMDEAGIGYGVVLPRANARGLGAVTNDEVAEGIKKYSERLIGFGAVDVSSGLKDPGDGRPAITSSGIYDATQEVKRAIKELGLKGIVMEPGCMNPPLRPDSAKLYPIYETCAELGVPVVISQSMYLGPDLSFANPQAVQIAAHDFPECNFIIAHASYPWVLQANAIACTCDNVYLIPDIYGHIRKIAGSFLYGEGIRFTQGRRFLFGTAYPVRNLKQSVDEAKAFGLNDNEWHLYTYENAAKLLNL